MNDGQPCAWSFTSSHGLPLVHASCLGSFSRNSRYGRRGAIVSNANALSSGIGCDAAIRGVSGNGLDCPKHHRQRQIVEHTLIARRRREIGGATRSGKWLVEHSLLRRETWVKDTRGGSAADRPRQRRRAARTWGGQMRLDGAGGLKGARSARRLEPALPAMDAM